MPDRKKLNSKPIINCFISLIIILKSNHKEA